MSVGITRGIPVWPGDPPIILERFQDMARGDQGNASRLSCSAHVGTHVDAPIHFVANGAAVENLPLDILIGPCWVAELRGVRRIELGHLKQLVIPHGTTRLLLKTDNSYLWSQPDHVFNPDFAALTPGAACWIVEQGVRLIGVDYLSVQLFDDLEPQTHRVLLGVGVVVVEGLDLSGVAPGEYRLVCLPMKLVGSDGAPARVVLLRDE